MRYLQQWINLNKSSIITVYLINNTNSLYSRKTNTKNLQSLLLLKIPNYLINNNNNNNNNKMQQLLIIIVIEIKLILQNKNKYKRIKHKSNFNNANKNNIKKKIKIKDIDWQITPEYMIIFKTPI
jgi:hypothetical protein